MKKIIKRITAQVIALAMIVQMAGQICPPFNNVKAHAENVVEQNTNMEVTVGKEESDMAESSESQDDPSSDFEEEPQFEDMTISNNKTLDSLTEVQNLYISSGTLDLNGNTLIVHGDVVITSSGNLKFNKGELLCNNFSMSGTYHSHYLYMQNPNDKLVVNGDFNFTGGYFSSDTGNSGVIEVAGNVNITYGFAPSGKQEFILNGLDKQIVYINGLNSKFNILEISNTSDEGVVSSSSIHANNITGSLNQIHYTFGGSIGAVLQGDSEINDNYYLSVGDLDLQGNTLTINGDFIQSGGNVILNGGHLIVNGDYLIQTENEDGVFTYSTGTLNMTNESDLVEVSGDFVMGSTKSHVGLLTNGTLTVGRDFSQLNVGSGSASNFSTSGSHTTIIKANENGNNISFENASSNYSHFNNLTFEKDSNVTISDTAVVIGILDGTACTVTGYVNLAGGASVNGKFCGDLRISEDYTLNSNINVAGNLYVGNSLYLSSYEFNVDGNVTQSSNLYINAGKLNCKGNYNNSSYLNLGNGKLDCDGDFNVEYRYGRIYMQSKNCELHIGGDFTFKGGYYDSSLTAGKLFVSGDCNVSESTFKTGSDYEIILNGSEKQILNITNSNANLSNIIIRNTSDEGIEIAKAFNYDTITNESEAKITFANGGSVGTTQTEKTKTIDGDYVLAMGDLDLQGNTLTINGDFI